MPHATIHATLLLPLALAALAGCDAKLSTKHDDGSGNVAIRMGGNEAGAVSIDTPVFKADVKLPGLNLGGHMNLDGIKLYPGSQVSGVNVDAQDRAGEQDDEGIVRIAFTSADPPARLLDYYTGQARAAGYATDAPKPAVGATMLHASKTEDDKPKQFDLVLSGQGTGTAGTITLTGE